MFDGETVEVVLELEFFDLASQTMMNKVEKVFFICTKDFSREHLLTLEKSGLQDLKFLCGNIPCGVHSNYGEIRDEAVYDKIRSML